MNGSTPSLRAGLLLAWLASSAIVYAQAPPTYSLPSLIERALERNAEIAAGHWQVRQAEAQLRKARAAYILPRLRLESLGGLVPDAEGDVFNPPSDTTGVRALGAFAKTEIELAQPLFTGGLLRNLKAAAAAGVEVEQAALATTKTDVIFAIKKLYNGILLTRDLRKLTGDLRQELAAWRDEINADDPDIPLSAPFKLQLALLELDRRGTEIDDKLLLAQAALAWRTGLPEGEEFALADQWLVPTSAAVPQLEQLYALALRRRPEWRQLQAGLVARASQEAAARSAYYPQIFLLGGLRYAVAPGRTDQRNPFVKDDFNLFTGGFFLGLRQSFEFGLLGADLDRARAKRRQLEATESTAAQGIRVDVRRARDAYLAARENLSRTRKARDLTREWLMLAQDEYEFDPAQVKELVSAFEALAGAEEAYYRALYDDNIALAELERAAGGRLLP